MRGAAPQPSYQSLYRACIKDAATASGALMQAMLARALEVLPQQAAQVGDVVERNLLLEAVTVLGEQQQALAGAFPQVLLAEFAQAIAGERSATLSFDALSLLGDEQLQENSDLVGAARTLEAAVKPQLALLEAALRAARLTAPGQAQRHPLRPEVYVRSIYRLARQSPVAPSVRRRWLRHLPPLIAPELARTYAAVAQRITPPPQPADAADAAEPTVSELPQADRDRATQLTIRELRQLLAGGPGEGADEAVIVFEDSEFLHTVPAALEMVQDMRKVDQLMLQLRQRQAAMPGRERDSLAAFHEALRQEAKRPGQALALEVVHLMVEHLAADPRLLPQVREVVRELEPPLLRLALVDPRFFSEREHPARLLLEQITQRGLAWTSAEEPGFAPFLAALHEATEALLDARASGPEAFDIARSALEEAWDEAQPRGRRNRERAVRALLRAEERNLLAESIGRQILDHPDAAGAPAEALAFLTGPWAQVMAQARIMDEDRSEDPGGYGALVQVVLWSVQPGKVAHVAARAQALQVRIRQALASIDYLPADTQRWLNLLAALRDLALTASAGDALVAIEPVPGSTGTWLAPLEMHESGFVPDASVALGATSCEPDVLGFDQLAVGAYVDLLADGWERWQLTWASPHGLLFMFTHASGATRSMTRRKLQQMVADGTMRLVSGHAVLDGALDAVAHAAWRNGL